MQPINGIAPQTQLTNDNLNSYYSQLLKYETSEPKINSVLSAGLPNLSFDLSGAIILQKVPSKHPLDNSRYIMNNLSRGSAFYPGVFKSSDDQVLSEIFEDINVMVKALHTETDFELKVVELDYLTNLLTIVLNMLVLLDKVNLSYDKNSLQELITLSYKALFSTITTQSTEFKISNTLDLDDLHTFIETHLAIAIEKYSRFFFFRRYRENSSVCIQYNYFTKLVQELPKDIDCVVGLEYGAIAFPLILNAARVLQGESIYESTSLKPKETDFLDFKNKNVLILDDSLCTGSSLSALLNNIQTTGNVYFSCITFNRIFKNPTLEINPNINIEFLENSFIPYRSHVHYAEDKNHWKHDVTQIDREKIIDDLLENYSDFDVSKSAGRV